MSRKIRNTNNKYVFESTDGYLRIPIGNNLLPPTDGKGSIRYNDILDRVEVYTSSFGWTSLLNFSDLSSLSLPDYVLKSGDIITGDLIFVSGNLILNEGSANNLSINFLTNANTGITLNEDVNKLEIYHSGSNVLSISDYDIRVGFSSNSIFLDNNTGDITFNLEGNLLFNQSVSGNDTILIIQNISARSILYFSNQSTTNYNIVYDSESDRLYIGYDINLFKNLLLTNNGTLSVNVSSSHVVTDTFEVRGSVRIIGENEYKLPTSAGLPGQYLVSNGPGNRLSWNTILTFMGITSSAFGGGIEPIVGISANREIITRSFTGGGIVQVSADPNGRIIISAASVNVNNSSLGVGINPIFTVSGSEIITRTFVGGGIVEVSSTPIGNIIISATNANLTLSSISNGIDVITNVSGSEIIQRRIQGKGVVDVRVSSNGTIIVSSMDNTFVDSNFRLILQRNFFTSPGILNINNDLSAFNEVYITFFNVFPSASGPLAFRMRINNLLVSTGSSYSYNRIRIVEGNLSADVFYLNLVRMTDNLDNSTSGRRRRSASGYIRFFSPNNLNLVSAGTSWISEVRYITGTGQESYYKTVGRNLYSTNSGTKFEGVRIFIDHSIETITGGLVKVYGRI